MSYHILHLLSPNLRVRLKLDQLHVTDTEKGTERTVPLADVAVIISAAQDLTVTAGALRRMAELNVLFLVCNERFEPCAMALPYHRATNTELLRRQVEWTPEWKLAVWRKVITAKVRNQAAVPGNMHRVRDLLTAIAERCTAGEIHPDAAESRAARNYWRHLLHRMRTDETTRDPGTRKGVNGMLDYGYAVVRTAVLRSLAAHGFIAALGIAHSAKAGSFALADDLMEPLRPWLDAELLRHLNDGGKPGEMSAWIPVAAGLLTKEVPMDKVKVRFLPAVDLYVESFAKACIARAPLPLRIPMLE
ncbi:MAG: type II CRISPR-associated endonuclease Cas1 [Verrucomicrobiia bacterium]|jgi:CRISPR-associated protein Cas1